MKNDMKEEYKKEFEEKIKKIKSVDSFKENDVMIKFIFDLARTLFEKKIDEISGEFLMDYGARALGAYAYLGVKASEKRAVRDCAVQTVEELEKDLTLRFKNEKSCSITEARAMAKVALSEYVVDVIVKEQDKNNYEHITKATEKMVSFIQSVLKQKSTEKIQSGSSMTNPVL